MKKLLIICMLSLCFNNTIINASDFNSCISSFEKENKISKSEVKYLNCSNMNLTSLENIKDFKNLETLILNNNELTNIDEIQKLKKLKVLDVSNNYLSHININDLNIEELYLMNNQIDSFNISLESLKILNLAGNNLTMLPESINNILSLQSLNISLNNISFLPNINGLIHLTNFEMQDNIVLKFPPSEDVPIETLNVEGNLITGNIITKNKTFKIVSKNYLNVDENHSLLNVFNKWDNKKNDLMNATVLNNGMRLTSFDEFEIIDKNNQKIDLSSFVNEKNQIIKEGFITGRIQASLKNEFTDATTTINEIHIAFFKDEDLNVGVLTGNFEKIKEENKNIIVNPNLSIQDIPKEIMEIKFKEDVKAKEEKDKIIKTHLVNNSKKLGLLIFITILIPFIWLFVIILKTKKLVTSIESSLKGGKNEKNY